MPQPALGIVGLGRMGAGMARRLARGGVVVAAFDRAAEAREALEEPGVEVCDSLTGLVQALAAPRLVWLMLPAGEVTGAALEQAADLLEPGDLLVDGGNAHYRDSMRRGAALEQRGLRFVDCGVSGGVWGLEQGYALMFGGSTAAARQVRPLARVLAPAPDRGWLHCGPVGSGHFVKMIHNGIEYGMMQALAEGIALLRGRPELDLDVAAVAEMWRHGSVVRSWLLDLTADILRQDPAMEGVPPVVADSGEGRWSALEAVDQGVPAPVIATALFARFASQGGGDHAARLLAMMRQRFGGHALADEPR